VLDEELTLLPVAGPSERFRLRDAEVKVTGAGGWAWTRKQVIATVTSSMASCHRSLHPDHLPHHARETITRSKPFRPDARRVDQSMSMCEGSICSAVLASRASG
jgi:hypothetical protein